MTYPKITSFRIKNFMSIEDASLTFDDSNILNIKGFNDSGKSGILKAMEVSLFNRYPRDQIKFIQDGKPGFSIQVNFEGGVSLLREKYTSGKSLYEMYKDGKLAFSTKRGDDLGRVDGVPEEIETFLGLCVTEDGTYLNSRAIQDPKLLVETTGSENFKSLHNVLKVEELVRAIAMINTDRNAVQGQITNLEAAINVDESRLTQIPEILDSDIEDIEKLEGSLVKEKDRVSSVSHLGTLFSEAKKYTDNSIPEVEFVNNERAVKVNNLGKVLSNIEELGSLPEVGLIDPSRSQMLKSLEENWKSLTLNEEIPHVEEIPDVNRAVGLAGMVKVWEALKEEVSFKKELDSKEKDLKNQLEKIHSELHADGKDMITCVFCERPQIIDLEGFGVKTV